MANRKSGSSIRNVMALFVFKDQMDKLNYEKDTNEVSISKNVRNAIKEFIKKHSDEDYQEKRELIRISAEVGEDEAKWLAKCAKARGIKISTVVREALDEYFKKLEKQSKN